MYDSQPVSYPLGVTDDPLIAAILKHQLIEEAKYNLHATKGKDAVMEAVFTAKLQQLEGSLKCLIPDEVEMLLLMELRERLDEYINRTSSSDTPEAPGEDNVKP